jgi:hypothetical protein
LKTLSRRCIVRRGRDSKPAHSAKSTAHPATNPKRPLKDLFDERDATRPGSKEEEQAAEKILESLFPDTNAVKVQTNYRKYPAGIKQHLVERIRDGRFLPGMAEELASWLQTRPSAPDMREPPAGWHKKFSPFTVCGEGEFVKMLFTIY